jgi:DNA-binding GntR family transcriptional regulator
MASDALPDSMGIARVTLTDRIYQQLLSEILNGQLASGSRLLIAHLANRFGTSQAPVREAIGRLAEEGLVDTEPYVGAVLKQPTWTEFEDIYRLRQELEVYSIRRLMANGPVKIKANHPVKQALKEMQLAIKSGDVQSIIDSDVQFHREVCALADSPLTLELWSTIMKRFRGARLSFESRKPDDTSTLYQSHVILLRALETNDLEIATQAFRNHLSVAMDRMRPKEG